MGSEPFCQAENFQSAPKIRASAPRGHDREQAQSKLTRAIQVGAIVLLVFQNSAEALIMRKSQTASDIPAVTQTGVILQELVKLFVSGIFIAGSGEGLQQVMANPWDLLCAGIPALLYLIQNNLQYVALSHLDAATFAVTYQLKILSTAVLSVWFLGKLLNARQWWALRLLVAGVGLVQVVNVGDTENVEFGALANPWAHASSDTMKGLAAVLFAVVLSGVAGVYTEKMLKSSSVSLWVRNAQLSVWSVLIGIVVLCGSNDRDRIRAEGFFVGYTGWTLAAIIIKSIGGLLVAVVIKYADNIAKNFSTAASMIITTIISSAFLGLQFRPAFLCGMTVVCYSTMLYNGVDFLAPLQKLLPIKCTPHNTKKV